MYKITWKNNRRLAEGTGPELPVVELFYLHLFNKYSHHLGRQCFEANCDQSQCWTMTYEEFYQVTGRAIICACATADSTCFGSFGEAAVSVTAGR